MHRILIFILAGLITFSSCGLRDREQKLEKERMDLNQKEQELLLKEESLRLKEAELAKREQQLDSTKILPDTLLGTYPNLPGTWAVKMVCSETTCPESAIGDTKTESWKITIQNNSVIAGALNNGKLTRVYSGGFTGDRLKLISQNTDNQTEQNVKIVVHLKQTKENTMVGRREIIRADDCHIVYDLELQKQVKKP
jgi:hypothetical protein